MLSLFRRKINENLKKQLELEGAITKKQTFNWYKQQLVDGAKQNKVVKKCIQLLPDDTEIQVSFTIDKDLINNNPHLLKLLSQLYDLADELNFRK